MAFVDIVTRVNAVRQLLVAQLEVFSDVVYRLAAHFPYTRKFLKSAYAKANDKRGVVLSGGVDADVEQKDEDAECLKLEETRDQG